MRVSIFISVVCCAALSGNAYAHQQPDPDVPSLLSEVPSVPGISAKLHGLNAGITLTAAHDSSSGWYELLTPAVAYTMGTHYSVDVSMPVYLHRLAVDSVTVTTLQPGPPGQPPTAVQTQETTPLEPHNGEPGDMVLAAHASLTRRWFSGTFTPSLTMPTGDSAHGLSTGRVTFDLDGHMQADARSVSFLLDLGGGDSSNLVNRLVTKDYTSLGPLAHFQAGVLVPLPGRMSFQTVAYEQLPLGDNKIYTTLSRPGAPDRTVVSGTSVSEDNGFTNSLWIPLSRHVTVATYYNRSLRLKLDTVAMSVTFVVRGASWYKPHRWSDR